MTTGHGEPIQRYFALEDREHLVGVISHDPRCVPDVSHLHSKTHTPIQRYLNGDLAPQGGENGNGDSLPPPPYGVAMTAGGKVLRFARAAFAPVSTRKGRLVVRLDPSVPEDLVVGVEASDGAEAVCLATRSARVLIFPVTEANVVAGPAKGVTAIKLDPKDRVLGFYLANRMREGLTVRTNRGATMVVRATKYPVASRGGRGYAVMQRGSLQAIVHGEPDPVPPVDQVEQ
jgi:DNA gyrase subunit A